MDSRIVINSIGMSIYYYLYFRLYKFARRIGTVDATWTSMLVISVLLFLNIATVSLLLFGRKVFFVNPKISGGIIMVVIGFVNYLIFIRNDKCNKIIKQFENESHKQKRLSIILSLIYIFFTVFLSHYFV